jgi:hypothetical protein
MEVDNQSSETLVCVIRDSYIRDYLAYIMTSQLSSFTRPLRPLTHSLLLVHTSSNPPRLSVNVSLIPSKNISSVWPGASATS